MKRVTIVTAALMFGVLSVSAQKPKLNKIESNILNGEIEEALEMVEIATEYEKTKDDPKTYYLRGLVYTAIDTTTGMSGLAENPLQKAVESYQKAAEMNEGGKEMYIVQYGLPQLFSNHVQNYWAYYFNKGATAYSSEDYATAVENFEKAQLIQPEDTNAYVNAGLAAQSIEQFDVAKKNYYKAIELGVQEKSIWNLLIFLVGNDGDYEEALRLTREIKKVYPNDNDLNRSEISLLIQLEQVEEAEENLKAQIAAEPDDPNLLFTLGILNEEMAESAEDPEVKKQRAEMALKAYQDATVVDPNHYNSQYNIGVILITKANEVIKERNALGVSREDLKKADELAPLIEERLKTALPQWEKIVELNDQELAALETLSYLYTQLKMYDEAEVIMDKIDALGGSGE